MAKRSVAMIADRKDVQGLIEALKDKDRKGLARMDAAQALGKIRDKSAVPALIEALKGRSLDVQVAAARALGEIRDKSAVPALIEAFIKGRSLGVQIAASESLGKIRDKSAVEALVQALKNQLPQVRVAASESLGEIRNELAVPALLELLGDVDGHVINAAVSALSKFKLDGRAVEPLVKTLNSYPERVWGITVAQIVVILGKIGDERAVEPLAKLGLGCIPDLPWSRADDYTDVGALAQEAIVAIRARSD